MEGEAEVVLSERFAWPSCSGLDRAIACPASCTLPQLKQPPGIWAERGTKIHKFLELAGTVGRDQALASVADDDVRAICEAIDVSVIPQGAEHEVALGLDLESGKAQRYDLREHRGYPDDGLLHGTADLVWTGGGFVYVLDFKTGRSRKSASEAWQLKGLAVMACAYAGIQQARVGLAYLNDDGSWAQDWDELDEFALADAQVQIASIYRKAKAGVFSVGEHCKYCPSLYVCPMQAQLARRMVPTLEEIDNRLAVMTPEERGQAWEKVGVAEALLDRIEDSLKQMAANEPIPLPSGKTLKEVPVARKQLAPGFGTVLSELTGVPSILAQMKATPNWIEETFGPEALAFVADRGYIGTVMTKQTRAVGGKHKKEKYGA